MSDLNIYCVTNKRLKFLEDFCYNLAWVGQNKAPDNYLKCNNKINIDMLIGEYLDMLNIEYNIGY